MMTLFFTFSLKYFRLLSQYFSIAVSLFFFYCLTIFLTIRRKIVRQSLKNSMSVFRKILRQCAYMEAKNMAQYMQKKYIKGNCSCNRSTKDKFIKNTSIKIPSFNDVFFGCIAVGCCWCATAGRCVHGTKRCTHACQQAKEVALTGIEDAPNSQPQVTSI